MARLFSPCRRVLQPKEKGEGSPNSSLLNECKPKLMPGPPLNHPSNPTHTSLNTTNCQVVFADGQTESVVSLPIVHDNDPDEGCEFVEVGVTAVSGTGSAVLDGGIHDVSAEAVVLIEEDDFTSAVRTAVPPEGLNAGGGGLSLATAEVGGVYRSNTF